MGYQPIHTPAIKHPPGNSTFFCGKCDAPLAREDVHALSWEDTEFSCSTCGTLYTHRIDWSTFWLVRAWNACIYTCARICLHLKYGMDIDDFYQQLSVGSHRIYQPLVSPDEEAFPFVYTSPYIGKRNTGDRDTPYYPQGQSTTALLALMKGIEQSMLTAEEVHRAFSPYQAIEPYEPPIEPSEPMSYYPIMEEDV